ncbi:hypothetical protein ABT364_03320 [Massilia sp. SR12]
MKFFSFFILLALSVPSIALADGLALTNGRYLQGRTTVFDLTPSQRAVIKCIRERRTDNTKTPYVFRLTAKQAAVLKRDAGLSPERFQVYETWRGFNDAGPHWNLVLRYNEAQIEVPHDLLLPIKEAEYAEFKVQGWAPNHSLQRICSNKAQYSKFKR